MTQPENKPEPKNEKLWWILDNTYPGEGYKIEEWCDHLAKFVQPIARVLTPDEVAAKDAKIERLQTGLQHYACECVGPCFLYGADIEKCGATAWEALNDRKKFSDMEVADTFRKLDAETISPLQEILIRQHEKITKLEAGLKKITDTDDLTITLDPLGSKRIAADTLTKAKEC